MRGVDRQRREDREDALGEHRVEVGAVAVGEVVPVDEADAVVLERWGDLLGEDRGLPCDELVGAGADGAELVDEVEAVGVVVRRPAESCSMRPATRTSKNSSRLSLKMARNLTRSSSGREASSARREHPRR